MTDDQWAWAQLDDEELDLVRETEEHLGADYVLVYDHGGGTPVRDVQGLRPKDLDETDVERLRVVERQVGGVAVAYERTD